MGTVDDRLIEMGIVLPQVATPSANYLPSVRSGDYLFVAGQLPRNESGEIFAGKLGLNTDVETAYEAAKSCALYSLSVAKLALGSLDSIKRVVRVMGLVNSTPDFTMHPAVINGFSDFMAEVLGDSGKHARVAYGVSSLPAGAIVEVETLYEVTSS